MDFAWLTVETQQLHNDTTLTFTHLNQPENNTDLGEEVTATGAHIKAKWRRALKLIFRLERRYILPRRLNPAQRWGKKINKSPTTSGWIGANIVLVDS